VGGPQYRAGSHRQFTLLARQLAEQGIASIRFDYRGMGDSEGDMRDFLEIDDDIRAAIDHFTCVLPSLQRVVIWALCDGASAALCYAPSDARVSSLVLLNPWVHTEAAAARARLRFYYLDRLTSKAFWGKLLSGNVRLLQSVRELFKQAKSGATETAEARDESMSCSTSPPDFIMQMLSGMRGFCGNVLLILSGNDLTAQEFMLLLKSDKRWAKVCARVNVQSVFLQEANHTFSSRKWRKQVEDATSKWTKEADDAATTA